MALDQNVDVERMEGRMSFLPYPYKKKVALLPLGSSLALGWRLGADIRFA